MTSVAGTNPARSQAPGAGPATVTAPATPATTPVAPPARSGAVLALTSAGVFVVFLDTTIVNVAFEAIQRSFRSSTAGLSWIFSAYSLVFAALLMTMGRVADQYGRKRTFQIGLIGFAVTSAACGLAPGTGTLIAFRALQAAAAAAMVPSSLSLLLAATPIQKRASAVGLWGAMGALAAATGPTVGALLVQHTSWRWVFLINVPICAVALVLGRTVLAENREPDPRALPEPLGIALLAAAPGALCLGIVQGPTWGWGSARVIGLIAGGVVMLVLLAQRLRTADDPVIDPQIFRTPTAAWANVATLLFSIAFFGLVLANIIFLQSVWHYSVLKAALAVTPGPFTAALVAPVAGRVADKRGHRGPLVAGSIVYACAALLLATRVGSEAHYVTHWLPVALLSGIGIGLTFALLSGAAVHELPPAQYAAGSAVNGTFRQLGAVIGVSLFAAILGTPAPDQVLHRFHVIWFVLVGAAGLTALASTRAGWAGPGKAESKDG
ncbi:MAG TPA: MFS transporter [Mycobacteriales bacterium]|nr:MFS transporter [Mycobacteriales bacterium]